jgi:hypothetical protein
VAKILVPEYEDSTLGGMAISLCKVARHTLSLRVQNGLFPTGNNTIESAGRLREMCHLNYARSDDLTAHRRDPVGYRVFTFRLKVIENIA